MTLWLNNRSHSSEKDGDQSVWEDTQLLIQECIAQNRAAQKALYNKYAPQAYATIKRYTKHDELADEMLNDAFFKVFTKISSYSGTGSFEGWIKKVVTNTVMDHLRKYVKDQQVYHAAEIPEEVYMSDDIVGKLSYKELLAIVQELPDTQRIVFNLFVFEDYKHKDISETLGISEVNSRWHLNDARKRLKDKINSIMKR
ncbi:MAG: sigma-70 family RNA polymerase sigma factor [Chitinophagaceae bacterium]|nr:sigma-70 family RNA polymerase sigma factor [Chitinophagaceae bacterium]MCB9045232.1 sigma-70 family RNA polymerase sigma factor [Chitinophagales bacterium]